MNLPREAFINHFALMQVHCLKFWPKRSKAPPEILPGSLYEWVKTSNGRMDLTFRPAARSCGPLSTGCIGRPTGPGPHRTR